MIEFFNVVMSMEMIISSTLLICMAWFGITFVYFLVVVRKELNEKDRSWSLTKDINQLGKIHKKYLAIKIKQSPDAIWPHFLVVTNVISFFMYVGIFLTLLIRGIMSEIM